MKKIMILSVGGSAEPIVHAIKKGKADHYYFFCSSGVKGSAQTIDNPGDPCGDSRKTTCPLCDEEYLIGDSKGKAIVYQAGLEKAQYTVVTVSDPDDLNQCYSVLLDLNKQINEQFGEDCQITANYTGGTKTMSVAMALIGMLTEKWDLAINKGPRLDLIKVRSGDTPVIIEKWLLYCENQLKLAKKEISDFDYGYADAVISEILNHPLDKFNRDNLLEGRILCESFDLWDKLNHRRAFELIANCQSRFSDSTIALKKIIGKNKNANGYEIVGDLLNNAARRAHRGLYDDAVARLYRATELFAQIRLEKQFGYKSDELKLTDLPDNLRPVYKTRVRDNNRLLLGLHDDYELLLKLNDPVGTQYALQKYKIINVLKKRNDSIFAHGLKPLEQIDYREVRKVLGGFIDEASKAISISCTIPQFPQEGIV